MTDRAAARVVCLAWSRVWSPLVPDAWRAEAWQLLDLPGAFADVERDYWSTFHVGLPGPRVALLLHAALGTDGGHAREDWLRLASHLGLAWEAHTLPPDHVAVACEILACALSAEEDAIAREACTRYLLPWCESARARLASDGGPLAALPARFAADLRSVAAAAHDVEPLERSAPESAARDRI